MQPFSQKLVYHRGVNINRSAFFDDAGGDTSNSGAPLGEIVVPIRAGHLIRSIGGPIQKADSLLGQKTLTKMILDDHKAF